MTFSDLLHRLVASAWTACSCGVPRLLAAATGVSAKAVLAMTLSAYDGAALQLDSVSHRLDPTFPSGH
jgi:hypothetical protein